MRRYEMMVIISDLLEEEAAQERFTWVKGLLDQQGASLVDEAWWGKRRFAYEIAKRHHGWYGVVDIEAEPDGLAEVERQLKINDDIVRFKSVRPSLRYRKAANA